MTTSDLQSGLRRALTTLESSLLSDAGLPPNPTDDLNTPEERLAARMVRRLSLNPPVDVLKIAESLGTVTEKHFPLDVDGLCLDLKIPGKRPKIWLSKGLGRIRKRFTLAHEIGHIVIPWHTGSIVDDLEAPRTAAHGMYRQMEAEANRFAAELLMPSAWVKSLCDRADHAGEIMSAILRIADVSFPAALFRTEKLGPAGYVVAKVTDGVVEWSSRTRGTRSRPPEVGFEVERIDMPAAFDPHVIQSENSNFYWWKMREEVEAGASPTSEWREILEIILSTIPIDNRPITRSRINAVLGFAIGRLPAGASVDQIYSRFLESFQNRSDRDRSLAAAISHPEFKSFLLARAHDRAKSD